MKVLQFVPSLNPSDGGTTTYMQQLTPVMGRLCELHVCALGDATGFVPLPECTVHSITLSMKNVFRMKREWIALLDEVRPDIVHVNCCWMPQCALVTRWTDKWRRKNSLEQQTRLFLTPHGMLEPWIMNRNYWTRKLPAIWLYQRKAVSMVDVIVATAESEREHLLQLGWNSRIMMVQNGINVKDIVMKSEWKKPRQLLFMSRIHPKKGLEMLFGAMASGIRNRSANDFFVKIAGEGDADYVQSLKTKVKELGLSDCVEFVGAVYGEEKWKLIRNADVVVLPTYSENYGLIVAEALASGTPVLTTTGTPWKSISDRKCGWWVDPTVEDISNALTEVSRLSETDISEYGRRARALAEVECNIDDKIRDLYHLYLPKK